MFTTAIVTSKLDASGPLEASLRRTGLVNSVQRWTPDRSDAAAVVPDVVFLDLAQSPVSIFSLAVRLRELAPKILLVGWSSSEQPSSDVLLEAMRSGLQDFISAPIDAARVKEVLGRATTLDAGKHADREPRVTVVMGVKGGAGATTVAVNLGVQLAKITGKRVALLDFARPLGYISLFLDLQPRFSVVDAVENLENLDQHLFNGFLSQHKSGVSVLAGSSHPDDSGRLSAAAMARIIEVAQSSHDFVLVDLSAPDAPATSSVLMQAHSVVMVAGVDAVSLCNLERHVSTMEAMGIDSERLRIVINRWHVRDGQMLNGFLERTKCSILARVSNDFPQVNQAITLGVPLPKNHRNPLCAQFRQLAAQLAGLAPAPEENETSGGLFYMLRASTARLGLPWHRVSVARTT